MAVNPNWARWSFASVATLLKKIAREAGIPALVEGLDERTTEFMEAPQRVEIRMSGPYSREMSKDYYEVSLDINVLFTSRYEINGNQYDILVAVGKFHEALDHPIPLHASARSRATMAVWWTATFHAPAATMPCVCFTSGRPIRRTGRSR